MKMTFAEMFNQKPLTKTEKRLLLAEMQFNECKRALAIARIEGTLGEIAEMRRQWMLDEYNKAAEAVAQAEAALQNEAQETLRKEQEERAACEAYEKQFK